ncbi:MAG: hypothetical protein AAF039_09235 [Bacteroidota bacterium]
MDGILKRGLGLFALVLMACGESKFNNGVVAYAGKSGISDFAPELWLEGNTFKGSFSDDYKVFYFFRKLAPEVETYIPYRSIFENGKWEAPIVMEYYNKTQSYTYQLKVPNSNTLLFMSNARTKKDTTEIPNYNFWQIELLNDRFGEPKELGYENLVQNYNSQPCITNRGSLFFTSDLPDWSKTLSYKMRLIGDTYSEPELFMPVNRWRRNKDWSVYEFCMSPEENYMIISIQDNTEDRPSVDLYISHFKRGEWTYPHKLGHDINTEETENFPTITNDGKYLLFTRAFSQFKIVSTKEL